MSWIPAPIEAAKAPEAPRRPYEGTDIPDFDTLIVDATIVDGSGSPSRRGSVAIRQGRIVATERGGTARRTIDAGGAVACPGFIDLHTHSDFTLPAFPRAPSMVRQGVTTQVVGNCGFSPFPAPVERLPEIVGYTAFLDGGLDWSRCGDAASYLAYLESLPLAANVAVQVGLGSVRLATKGFEAGSSTPREISLMQAHLRDAFEAGVVGVSSGLTYAPGRHADTVEVTQLVGIAARYGGFYSTHLRNEAGALLDAVNEALTIARRAGVPLQLSHHKALGVTNRGLVASSLAAVDAARADGVDVLADQYPYRAGSTTLAQILPDWALEGGVDGLRSVLADPTRRDRISREILSDTIRREFDPSAIVLAGVPVGPYHQYQGAVLSELAHRLGRDSLDLALDLIAAEGTSIVMTVFGMAEEDVRRVMSHPAVAIASDGWTLSPAAGGHPHPRSYGTFARVLGRYVREERVLSLEAAIHKMTGLPATRLHGSRRGSIAPGMVADLVVFDPDRVSDLATFERPHRFCEGVHHVLVAGESVVEDGQETGSTPGKVLRRQSMADPIE